MNTIKDTIANLSQEQDGAQVVEYALIIAVVSIVLVLALGNSFDGIAAQFATFVGRVGTCLSSGSC